MSSKRPQPRETLSRNLKRLMESNNHTYRDLAKISGVSAKTIGNMLNGVYGANLDNVEAVAAAYGLSGWQLIIPDLPIELSDGKRIGQLCDAYKAAGEEGRRYIETVADREAKLAATGKK